MSDRDGTLNTQSDRTLASGLRALPDAAPQPDLWPELARALEERHRAFPSPAQRGTKRQDCRFGQRSCPQGVRQGWRASHVPKAEGGALEDRRRAFPSPAKRGKVPKAEGGALKVHARHEVAKSTGIRALKFLPFALAAAVALAMVLPRGKLERAAPQTVPAIATTTPVSNPALASEHNSTVADELDRLHARSQTLERWIAVVAARAPQDSRDLMAAVEVEDLIGLVDVQLGAAHERTQALPLWRQRVALLEDLATIRGSAYAIAANDDGTSNESAALPNRIN